MFRFLGCQWHKKGFQTFDLFLTFLCDSSINSPCWKKMVLHRMMNWSFNKSSSLPTSIESSRTKFDWPSLNLWQMKDAYTVQVNVILKNCDPLSFSTSSAKHKPIYHNKIRHITKHPVPLFICNPIIYSLKMYVFVRISKTS